MAGQNTWQIDIYICSLYDILLDLDQTSIPNDSIIFHFAKHGGPLRHFDIMIAVDNL